MNLITPNWAAPLNIRATTTLRQGGFSSPPYESMNLATHVGDKPSAVKKNRELLSQVLTLPQTPFWLNQVHGTRVVERYDLHQDNQADACFTRIKKLPCVVLTADCLPILLCNQQGNLVAAIHAGWKSLVKGIIESTVHSMKTDNDTLMAWLGPAIGPKFFEVGHEVRDAFMKVDAEAAEGFKPKNSDKWLCDIFLLATQRLNQVGIKKIYGGYQCTYNHPEHFFSFRRDNKITGRMATLIWFE